MEDSGIGLSFSLPSALADGLMYRDERAALAEYDTSGLAKAFSPFCP